MKTCTPMLRTTDRIFERRGWISAAIVLPTCAAVVFSPPWFAVGSGLDVLGDLVAWLLLGAGIFLRLWATLYIGGRKSVELVTSGPYAICRHPLYLASFLIIVALGVFLSSISLLLVAALISIVYIVVVIPSEERHAALCFGEEYLRYSEATPRLLPRTLRIARPGTVRIKVAESLREFARTFGLIALAASADLLAYCRTQAWWPVIFHLP